MSPETQAQQIQQLLKNEDLVMDQALNDLLKLT